MRLPWGAFQGAIQVNFMREYRCPVCYTRVPHESEALANPLVSQSGTGILPVIHGWDAHATRSFARASSVEEIVEESVA